VLIYSNAGLEHAEQAGTYLLFGIDSVTLIFVKICGRNLWTDARMSFLDAIKLRLSVDPKLTLHYRFEFMSQY